MPLREVLEKKLDSVHAAILDDDRRRDFTFSCFNTILGFVSGGMTVVNIFTGKWLLMAVTLVFALLCLGNILLCRKGGVYRAAGMYVFVAEAMLLCTFFCISGIPEGFSALWTCFIPCFSLTLYGCRKGSVFSTVGYLVIVLLFWTPMGRELLQYAYTDSFMLRFPMIYAAFYLISLFLEQVRQVTHRQLTQTEQRYQHLYKHDALTGIYNRYGFNEKIDEIFASGDSRELALLMIDLDWFKNVNDTYGHDAGDAVLQFAAKTLREMAGADAMVARWGGEEFTVLLQGAKDPVGLAEQIRQKFEVAAVDTGNYLITITVSIGVCVVSDRKKATIGQMVRGADQCLYQAKDAGRNAMFSVHL